MGLGSSPKRIRAIGSHREGAGGFTLIELLIVVGIIAVLFALLVAALGRAVEQARIAKCLSNQRSLVQAVHAFAADHGGYGQLIDNSHSKNWWKYVDSGRRRYVYESGTGLPAPWPMAYASYLGEPDLRTVDFTKRTAPITGRDSFAESGKVGARRRLDVLLCPSDKTPVGEVSTGADLTLLCDLSYAINADIFHVNPGSDGGIVWRDGHTSAPPLNGQLSRIEGPSEVVMFADGGPDHEDPIIRSSLRAVWSGGGSHLPDYQWAYFGLPIERHSRDGALCAALADGHAEYLRPAERRFMTQIPATAWAYMRGVEVNRNVPTRYAPNPRITPYRFDPSKAPKRR